MFGLMLPKGLFQYTLMPQVMLRLHGLLTGGFHYLPFFLAVVYRNFRLLPEGHPYLSSRNIGRFGVRHVIAQAAGNLRFSYRNVDQLILFVIILGGILLVFLQFLSIGAYFFMGAAMAMPTSWSGFFTINILYRYEDLASMMLDLVFGVPHPDILTPGGLFESCVGLPGTCIDLGLVPSAIPDPDLSSLATTIPANQFAVTTSDTTLPWAHHAGLHSMFAVYSNGLLVIACGMISYFIATILAETAQTGTPFGRRYNKTWVPFRIIMAFGLLMPLGSGLNSAQYIVLFSAKYGSAFASNGWRYFNTTLTTGFTGDITTMVTTPTVPDVGGFLQFMFVANVCEILYENTRHDHDGDGSDGTDGGTAPVNYVIQAYIHGPEDTAVGNTEVVVAGTSFADLINRMGAGNNTVVISFGDQNSTLYAKERGYVKPLCGQIRWMLADPRPFPGTPGPGVAEPGPGTVQQGYWELLKNLWFGTNSAVLKLGTVPTETDTNNRRDYNFVITHAPDILPPNGTDDNDDAYIGQYYKNTVEERVRLLLEGVYAAAAVAQYASTSWLGAWAGPTNPLYRKGWAAAGIWYNKIAELNGNLTVAAFAMPLPYKYPAIMEEVWSIKVKHENEVRPKDRFTPEIPKLKDLSKYIGGQENLKIATVLGLAFKAYDAPNAATTHAKPSGSVIFDAITALLGTNGLYDMRRNPNAHPLAQVVGIGRALVESAVRNLGYASIATVSGIMVGDILGEYAGQLASTAASLFITIAMMALTIGFLLFYIVPFLPFIYFFFAVGGWVKGIFEAMVGAPLWALAHIRIDAHGLPGNAALNGYFLIFEIFVRPILILFGFLASISIFAALVSVLHSIFPMVTNNVSGYNIGYELSGIAPTSTLDSMRGKVDQFFFTVIYAIIVYMIGMSSFKLIDTIPNNILRWMGSSVATFNDQREDPAQGLMSKASVGTQQSMSRIGQGLQGIAGLAKSK